MPHVVVIDPIHPDETAAKLRQIRGSLGLSD